MKLKKGEFRIKKQRIRVNNRIYADEVRLISQNKEQVGVVSVKQALQLAQEAGLDLVEISPKAKPPVCKIIDYGKYKYEIQKKASQAKKKQKIITLKELKMRPSTDKHDYDFKMKNAKKFISKGDKVKFTIRFKGREMDYMKAAYDLVDKIITDTKDISKVEQKAKLEGRQMTLIIQPN